MSTARFTFTVEKATSLEELIREADAEAQAIVETSLEPRFYSASILASTQGGTVQGDFTYEVRVPK